MSTIHRILLVALAALFTLAVACGSQSAPEEPADFAAGESLDSASRSQQGQRGPVGPQGDSGPAGAQSSQPATQRAYPTAVPQAASAPASQAEPASVVEREVVVEKAVPESAGPRGPVGPAGPAGAAGSQGAAGPTGPQAYQGPTIGWCDGYCKPLYYQEQFRQQPIPTRSYHLPGLPTVAHGRRCRRLGIHLQAWIPTALPIGWRSTGPGKASWWSRTRCGRKSGLTPSTTITAVRPGIPSLP